MGSGHVKTELLLDTLAGRLARGEPLRVDELLRQAGPEADRLAAMIDTFLSRSPRGEPSADARAFVASLGGPPLLLARVQRGLRVDEVVDGIVAECKVPSPLRAKVRRYYQMLEGGTLDPSGVAMGVWDALRELFDSDVRRLLAIPPRPTAMAAAYYRSDADAVEVLARAEPEALFEEPDEADRLFGVSG